jgi:hypothetical protein
MLGSGSEDSKEGESGKALNISKIKEELTSFEAKAKEAL